ncbi:MAG: PIN domain-containing protein [Campylobacterota bacterium]|nr:PIN domain-containing protein [Campylobacterota bacterium]
MKYIIDSDILIYFLKGREDVVKAMIGINPESLFTTRINATELLYGAYNSAHIEKNLQKIIPFLKNFKILEFDELSSEIFAKLKAKLKKSGNPIADMDLMIASIALANNAILVTNNTKHFERIEELTIENWAKT